MDRAIIFKRCPIKDTELSISWELAQWIWYIGNTCKPVGSVGKPRGTVEEIAAAGGFTVAEMDAWYGAGWEEVVE